MSIFSRYSLSYPVSSLIKGLYAVSYRLYDFVFFKIMLMRVVRL